MSDLNTQESQPDDGVFGEGFASMFEGSPHGAEAPKPVEPIEVEVPGKTDAAAADAKTEPSATQDPNAEAKADQPKPDASDKPAAPPGLIAERRARQNAERETARLSDQVQRQGQVLEELLAALQPRRTPDFVTDPQGAARQVYEQAAAHAQAEAQRMFQQAEQARMVHHVHQTANASQETAAKTHGADVVSAALDWAKATGRSGAASPYLGSADPYADLMTDFRSAMEVQAKVLGYAPPQQRASAPAAGKPAAPQVRIPPTLVGATPAGAAARQTVKDNDAWFSDEFRPGA